MITILGTLTVLWAGFTVVYYPIFMRVAVQHSRYIQGAFASPFFMIAIFVLARYFTGPAWELALLSACFGAMIGSLIGQMFFDRWQIKADYEERGPDDDEDVVIDTARIGGGQGPY
jgi:hypothetical protein